MTDTKNDIEEPKLTITLGDEDVKDAKVESKLEAPVTVEPASAETTKEGSGRQTLEEFIREQATDEDMPLSKTNLSLSKILGGDILMAEVIRRQVWLFMLITFFLVIYIAQRYSYDKYITEIAKLNTELQDAKFSALSATSELTESTRQSKVLDLLKLNNDSTLHTADRPPYIIEVPEE